MRGLIIGLLAILVLDIIMYFYLKRKEGKEKALKMTVFGIIATLVLGVTIAMTML
ncbi:hypothetical protein [Bacillus sp. 165]|uniref:hypothetical protein n=1 Tax=Bacillus sp. 165 TaxID=1529117 RepID=UPI001ADD2C3B|nr:hypothetical protein [Bacillus sp. 165]MBO9129351.1 hypothetical protein [Bacillus sp. 165]